MNIGDTSAYSIEVLLAITLITYFIGGVVKGTLGLGMPITVVSVMTFVIDARTAVLLVLMPVVITNLWQIIHSGQLLQVLRRYWKLTVSMSYFLISTSVLAANVPIHIVMLSIGVAVVLFAALNLWISMPEIPDQYDGAAQLMAGLFTGVLGGISGLIVVPLVAYFSACNLDKDSFITVTSPFFLLGGCLLIVSFSQSGLFAPDMALLSTLLVVPAVAGLLAGEKIRRHLPADIFKRLVLIIFFLMGVNMIFKGVML